MRVLVACEESQVVTSAFRSLGHEAFSCDIVDCSGGHPEWHIKKDFVCVFDDIMSGNFDIPDILIAHPPCDHLASSGARWFVDKIADGRIKRAFDFFMLFVYCTSKIEKVAIENPIGIMSTRYRKPDQIIQPWQFGHPESKATCLWLFNLPNLIPTNILEKPESKRWDNQTKSGQNKIGPSINRKRVRSKTYEGIALAMATQWSQ